MKKLLVIPLLVLSASVFAQKFQLGLKGGVNISNFSGLNWNNVDTRARLGFHGGAFLNLMLGDNFSISPEAQISSQGAKIKDAGQEYNMRVSYLAIPVLLKYRFNGGFYIEAGPQVAIKIDENTEYRPIDVTTRNLDLAFDAGLGYHGASGLGIGARYVVGLSKVGDFDAGNGINPDYKNGVAQVFVFYTLFNNRR